MKVRYDKKENILMIELVNKKIDDAYETENMIVHVDKNKRPVLLEIFDAHQFFKEESKTLPLEIKQKFFAC